MRTNTWMEKLIITMDGFVSSDFRDIMGFFLFELFNDLTLVRLQYAKPLIIIRSVHKDN